MNDGMPDFAEWVTALLFAIVLIGVLGMILYACGA